jgi:carboxymethylenebutenolidase
MTGKGLSRRTLLAGMGRLGCAAGVATLLCERPAMAETTKLAAAGAATETTVQIAGIDGLSGYLARPRPAGKYPGVIVAHGERGLDALARDVALRLGAQGFLALAVDYLGPAGGAPKDQAQAIAMMRRLGFTETLERSRAAFAWLKARADCNGKIGAIGFGWGGGVASDLAVIEPGVAAAVSYYGPQSNYFLGLEYKDMKAAIMLHYAGRNRAINVGIPQFDGILRNEATVPTPEIFVYTGVDHGFADPADSAHYDKQAADLAWSRSIAFLKKYLG